MKEQTISEYTLQELQNSEFLIENELNDVFVNLFKSYNKDDTLESLYKEYNNFFLHDSLFLMFDIEKKFENCNVELNNEHFDVMITVRDVFDEVKKQIMKGKK